MIYGNVVVPVDFSEGTDFAVNLGLSWAKVPNGRITVVHAVDLDRLTQPNSMLAPEELETIHPAFHDIRKQTAAGVGAVPWAELLPLARKLFEKWANGQFEMLRKSVPSERRDFLDFRLLHGDAVEQIIAVVETVLADLVVVAAHKHSTNERIIDGSHVEKLVRNLQTPVMAISAPLAAVPAVPREILVTTDYSLESLAIFRHLFNLIVDIKPNITVLAAETLHEHHRHAPERLKELEGTFGNLGIKVRNVRIEATDVEGGILDYVRTHRPQLIAMSSHGRLGFSELIHPSMTKAILYHSDAPLLIVNQGRPQGEDITSVADLLRVVTG